jgi:hypothetical protein
MPVDATLGLTAVFGMALLFASAAWHKWRSDGEFAATLGAYEILPAALTRSAAAALPALELLSAAALLVPQARTAGMIAAALLLLMYAGAIVLNLKRGRHDLDCGCMVAGKRGRIAAWMVWRNAGLALLLLLMLPPWTSRGLGVIDLLTIAAATLIAALLYQSANLLLGVSPRARPGASS